MSSARGTAALPKVIQQGGAPLEQAIASLQVGTPAEAYAQNLAIRLGIPAGSK